MLCHSLPTQRSGQRSLWCEVRAEADSAIQGQSLKLSRGCRTESKSLRDYLCRKKESRRSDESAKSREPRLPRPCQRQQQKAFPYVRRPRTLFWREPAIGQFRIDGGNREQGPRPYVRREHLQSAHRLAFLLVRHNTPSSLP